MGHRRPSCQAFRTSFGPLCPPEKQFSAFPCNVCFHCGCDWGTAPSGFPAGVLQKAHRQGVRATSPPCSPGKWHSARYTAPDPGGSLALTSSRVRNFCERGGAVPGETRAGSDVGATLSARTGAPAAREGKRGASRRGASAELRRGRGAWGRRPPCRALGRPRKCAIPPPCPRERPRCAARPPLSAPSAQPRARSRPLCAGLGSPRPGPAAAREGGREGSCGAGGGGEGRSRPRGGGSPGEEAAAARRGQCRRRRGAGRAPGSGTRSAAGAMRGRSGCAASRRPLGLGLRLGAPR